MAEQDGPETNGMKSLVVAEIEKLRLRARGRDEVALRAIEAAIAESADDKAVEHVLLMMSTVGSVLLGKLGLEERNRITLGAEFDTQTEDVASSIGLDGGRLSVDRSDLESIPIEQLIQSIENRPRELARIPEDRIANLFNQAAVDRHGKVFGLNHRNAKLGRFNKWLSSKVGNEFDDEMMVEIVEGIRFFKGLWKKKLYFPDVGPGVYGSLEAAATSKMSSARTFRRRESTGKKIPASKSLPIMHLG